MEYFVVICGALGAWLLVAGPVYQAALELREQEIDREGINKVTADIPTPERLSPWWWLLPPVAYILQQRRSQKYQHAMLAAMTPEQIAQAINFMNKAGGWLLVASGAFFIAVKETWQLTEELHWPTAVFWVLVVVVAIACVMHAVLRIRGTEQLVKRDEAAQASAKHPPARAARSAQADAHAGTEPEPDQR